MGRLCQRTALPRARLAECGPGRPSCRCEGAREWGSTFGTDRRLTYSGIIARYSFNYLTLLKGTYLPIGTSQAHCKMVSASGVTAPSRR